MKKLFTIMLTLIMLFAITVFIVGCGNGETVVEAVATPTPTAEATPTPTPTPEIEIEIEVEDEVDEPEIVLESYFVHISGEVLSVEIDGDIITIEVATTDDDIITIEVAKIENDVSLLADINKDTIIFNVVNGAPLIQAVGDSIQQSRKISVGDHIDAWYPRNMSIDDISIIVVNLPDDMLFRVDRFPSRGGNFYLSEDETFALDIDIIIPVVNYIGIPPREDALIAVIYMDFEDLSDIVWEQIENRWEPSGLDVIEFVENNLEPFDSITEIGLAITVIAFNGI